MFTHVHMPSLGGATEWLDSEPLGPAGLRGHVLELPRHLGVNHWALTGEWTIRPENVALAGAGGSIA